ncbi:MAG: hypothetical protein ACLFM0_11570, partial [Spirochaetales bacterium]
AGAVSVSSSESPADQPGFQKHSEKVIRKRNRATAIKGKISRKRSSDRGSQAHKGADGRYLSGPTPR